MADNTKRIKVMIIAPFWRQPQHVGVYRIDRFVRWLSSNGVELVLVRAGSKDNIREESWGIEITVKDPIGLYHDPDEGNESQTLARRPNRLRRWLAYWLFNPDPGVVWARRAARHASVLEYGQGVSWVLSSSPPESTHVASFLLAKRLQAKLVIDMRDGWLDEPLKPLLKTSVFRQWQEGRWETRILRQSQKIFVTSGPWKTLLERRLPFTRQKTIVLTNGYPHDYKQLNVCRRNQVEPNWITLLHAGRFSGSSKDRNIKYLLDTLLNAFQTVKIKGEVLLLGQLEPDEMNEVARKRLQFETLGWSLVFTKHVPREKMLEQLLLSDGLLLLSTSVSAIPSKIFEYLPSGKPILCLTQENSAAWKLVEDLPQVFSIDYYRPFNAVRIVKEFTNACLIRQHPYIIPSDFSEDILCEKFLKHLALRD